MEGKLSSTTKAKSISQAFFQFLNGKTEQESFNLLSMILEGKKTVTELYYVPSGKGISYTFFLQFCTIIAPQESTKENNVKM